MEAYISFLGTRDHEHDTLRDLEFEILALSSLKMSPESRDQMSLILMSPRRWPLDTVTCDGKVVVLIRVRV